MVLFIGAILALGKRTVSAIVQAHRSRKKDFTVTLDLVKSVQQNKSLLLAREVD